ncbi:MAG: GvpL/GvpF family gas vesicle protein [Mariniphaga sp.]
MQPKGIYIYGIVPNFYSAEFFRSLKCFETYAIPFENVSAIVSDYEGTAVDFSDREALGHLLIHHQKTIEAIQEIGFNMLIPMKLGTIAKAKKEVFTILSNGYELIIETLKKIENHTEIDLVVTWGAFNEIIQEVAGDPEIMEMKEEILKKSDALSPVDQMKMGMMIQEKLKEKNTKVELNILDSLSSISLDIATHEVMNDQMITNSAFLIKRHNREKFEHIIDQIDEEYKGLLNFKLVGPLPCYSFYTIEVQALDASLVLQAKQELGLGDETSESEIKKVYLGKAKLFHPDGNSNGSNEENFTKVNKAYHTLLDYSVAVRQSSKEDLISLEHEKVKNNLILVRLKV